MRTVLKLSILLCVATRAIAIQRLNSIPFIDSVVASMVSDYDSYVTYNSTGLVSGNSSNPTPKRASTPTSYWMEDIKHQGIAAFNSDSTYEVFRNVKDFGAKGDGVTDDTAAINSAISTGNRCAPGSCKSSSNTSAVVYFPSGTYLISSSLIDFYQTQMIGNPNNLPIIKGTPGFTGFGLIDGDQYGAFGLKFGATSVFFRQIRNFVFDLTAIPATSSATGVHWPTAQATSLQNCVFLMSDAPGTKHQGLFIEDGSGGFLNDLVFYGGFKAVAFGNQQFTMRNLTFYNAVTAISQFWDWGWTYKSISINNCTTGLDMSSGGPGSQSVGSITFIDSSITNTQVGIITSHNANSLPATGGSLIIENLQLTNVPVAVQGPDGVALAGTIGSTTIGAWGQGHSYTPSGPTNFEGPMTAFPRPGSLLNGAKYYERSKPQYENMPVSKFCSVRSGGAKGNGIADDTVAIQVTILLAALNGKIVFFDAGTYRVTSTIYIPKGSKIVGESYSVIMGSGAFFSKMAAPQPVVRVGFPLETGSIEWSDMIISTQGATAGAILIEWNLASPASSPSGMWDVHTRIGGFAGSNLQLSQCPKVTTLVVANSNCIAAFMGMHVTSFASGLYMENVWLWTADHDLEDPTLQQITIYTGRGLLIESGAGNIWLVGTAVEHFALYQYQLAKTKNIFMGQIQTETAYYQPNPSATSPFSPVTALNDPNFGVYCSGKPGTCADGWGLRVLSSQNILVYGAGLYSFFNNYDTTCSNSGNSVKCQTQIFGIDGGGGAGTATAPKSVVYVYNLNTIGSASMIDVGGTSLASYADNANVYPANIAVFRSG